MQGASGAIEWNSQAKKPSETASKLHKNERPGNKNERGEKRETERQGDRRARETNGDVEDDQEGNQMSRKIAGRCIE